MKVLGNAILWHRWLGIGSCVFFLAWFVSGIVMMYAKMPTLDPELRQSRLPVLKTNQIHLSAAQAWLQTGEQKPWKQAILTSIAGRPAYRFVCADSRFRVVFADNGESPREFPQSAVEASVKTFLPPNTQYRWLPPLTSPDQWTVQRLYTVHLPLHHAAITGNEGTEIYVSSKTGEVILQTTTATRVIAWAGAIPHWLYLRAVRVYAEEWRLGVIYLSAIGSIMALLGIVVGIWRYSPSRRYRNRELGPQTSPYLGAKRWHHLSGLVFGVLAFTFILSGMLSLNPGRWSSGSSPTPPQLNHFTGGPIQPAAFDTLPPGLDRSREVEFHQIAGRPVLRLDRQWREQTGEALKPPSPDSLLSAAVAATGNAKILSTRLLTSYSTYYYDRKYRKPLPVLEVKLADPAATWFYLDPATGLPVNRYESTGRWERWLYHGLHSLDFPGLWHRRPLWDIVVIFASLGGIYLSWSGIQIGWERIRPKFARRPRSSASVQDSKAPAYTAGD